MQLLHYRAPLKKRITKNDTALGFGSTVLVCGLFSEEVIDERAERAERRKVKVEKALVGGGLEVADIEHSGVVCRNDCNFHDVAVTIKIEFSQTAVASSDCVDHAKLVVYHLKNRRKTGRGELERSGKVVYIEKV